MASRKPDREGYYCPPEACHYNICFAGGQIENRTTIRRFEGLKPEQIDWVWIVEEKRRATPDEIRKLCSRPAK